MVIRAVTGCHCTAALTPRVGLDLHLWRSHCERDIQVTITSTSTPDRVAVIGLGNLGSALAAALLDHGHDLTVWNRTAEKAAPLVARGATAAGGAIAAVTAAPLTVACVFQYGHLREALAELEPGDLEGRTIANVGWGSPQEADELGRWVTSLGGEYLDGGVPVTPSEIGLADTELIYSGPRAAWDRWAPVLTALGGASKWLGDEFGHSNIVSLSIPGTYYQVAYGVFFEAVAYAAARGVDPGALRSITTSANRMLETALQEAIDMMESGSYETDQATLDVMLDSFVPVREEMDAVGQRGTITQGMIEVLQRAVAAGDGAKGCSALFPLLRRGD
jgi:3-hydroxyisobutyrate dehydrogenase-like beta-hydroxyacid dehydrogenase